MSERSKQAYGRVKGSPRQKFEIDSIYAAFADPTSSCCPLLVIPLGFVVILQLSLLGLVCVSWTETMHNTAAYNFNIYPTVAACSNTTDAWSRFVLMLTNIGALCALAASTHAEVQAAVDLFEELRESCGDNCNAAVCADSSVTLDRNGMSPWRLLVPTVQLFVSALTLFVQGIVFQSYRINIADGEARYEKVMEAVYACVALAFICELDNKIWVFVRPLIQTDPLLTVQASTDSINQGHGSAEDSLSALLTNIWPGHCSSTSTSLRVTSPKCCLPHSSCCARATSCCCSCSQVLSCLFHVFLFVYECTFGMLLVLYMTDYLVNSCPAQLGLAILLGFSCFIVFQIVAGVRSTPLCRGRRLVSRTAGSCSGSPCTKLSWMLSRPVVLNVLAPLIVGGVARILFSTYDSQLSKSAWRCRAGAVLNCTPCNTGVDWCTATVACADHCKGGQPTAVLCMSDWCTNPACADCLVHANASMPPIELTTSITAADGISMCHGITSHLGCMYLWMIFVPVMSMLVLAGLFLWYEADASLSSCSRGVKERQLQQVEIAQCPQRAAVAP